MNLLLAVFDNFYNFQRSVDNTVHYCVLVPLSAIARLPFPGVRGWGQTLNYFDALSHRRSFVRGIVDQWRQIYDVKIMQFSRVRSSDEKSVLSLHLYLRKVKSKSIEIFNKKLDTFPYLIILSISSVTFRYIDVSSIRRC